MNGVSETVVIAAIAALVGFLGGLIPSISGALKTRSDTRLAVRASDLDALREIINQYRGERDDLQTRYKTLAADVDVERDNRRVLQEKISTFADMFRDKDKEIKELHQELGALKLSLAERDKSILGFNGMFQDKDIEIRALRTELETLKSNLLERDKTIAGLVTEVTMLRSFMDDNKLSPPKGPTT